jgi:PilZ domain-containing protein
MGLLDHMKSLAGIEEWDFSDRRGTLRIPCQLQARLRTSGDEVEAVVVDIGLRGLCLLIKGKIRKGSVVELLPRNSSEQPVNCKIQWKKKHSDGFLSGVSFQDDKESLSRSWLFEEVKAIGHEAVETEQRRSGVRVICNTPAKLKLGTEKREVAMIDLGLGGALIESAGDPFKTGDKVRLEFGPLEDLPRVAVNCEVVATYKRELPRYGLRIDTFFDGGVTDIEQYLSHFFAPAV